MQTQQIMLRKQILMPPEMAGRVQRIAEAREISFGEAVRTMVEAFDDTVKPDETAMLEALADALIASTQDTVKRVDALITRLDKTHKLLERADGRKR
jgi:hypothetical protein